MAAGSEVDHAWNKDGYVEPADYSHQTAEEVFESHVPAAEETTTPNGDARVANPWFNIFRMPTFREAAKAMFIQKFNKRYHSDDSFREEDRFYVVIGRKPVT